MGIKQAMVSSAKKPMMWAMKLLIKLVLIIGFLVGIAYGLAYGLDRVFEMLLELGSRALQESLNER